MFLYNFIFCYLSPLFLNKGWRLWTCKVATRQASNWGDQSDWDVRILGSRICSNWSNLRKSRCILIRCGVGGTDHWEESCRYKQTEGRTVPHALGENLQMLVTLSYWNLPKLLIAIFSTNLYLQARPLLKENAVSKLVDPCLVNCYSEKEVQAMMHCASLCLHQDPESRPRMSQVKDNILSI